MSSNYNVLITGANRGLGRSLLETFLSRPNHTLIAGVRDPSSPTSQSLLQLPAGEGSQVILVKLDSVKQADSFLAIQTLQLNHSIDHLDMVIANAGISQTFPLIAQLRVEDLQHHLETNVYGVVWLFQAVLPLLEKAKSPKWMSMSSSAGSIGAMAKFPHPNSAYGASKVMLNFHTVKMHCEHPNITAVALDPGFVQTEMGNAGAVKLGLEKAFITVEESISGIVKVIDAATRDTHSGRFINYLGEDDPW